MKTLSAACAVLFALLAYSPAAIAQMASAPSVQATVDRLDAASAARKHRHVRVYRYYNPLEQNRSFGFVGGYPGEYAWRRGTGQTVCDLGYGRWDSCDSR